MVERTWLYLYENTKAKKIYIGIGKSMERVFERHNRQAEDLRDSWLFIIEGVVGV